MKAILSILFVLFAFSAHSKNYYFSSTSGDDSRTASQANNSSTPWKSITKLNASFSVIVAGDSILFKRGDVFYGAITVTKSGSSSAPIIFSAYGSGNKPVITSLIKLSGWTSIGNGIYESYNASLGASIYMLLLNGKQQEMGRFPNSETENNGYLNFESHVGTSSITDNELNSNINWTGAELVMRPRRWVIDRDRITSHSGSTISYTATSSYAPYDKMGYFIQNSMKTLDRLGEWYYNPSTKKMNMFFGSSSPSSYSVEVPELSHLISVTSYSYLVFDNLNIKGTNGSGMYIKSGANISIKNCDVAYSGESGISANNHNYLKVENCTVNYSNKNGIDLFYLGDNATLRSNKITNTALFPGNIGSGDGIGFGIRTNGNGNVVEYNEIINTGYIGIQFNGNNVTIKNNFIDNFCFVKDDGAGIYSHTGSGVACTNRKVIGNIIMNGVGAAFGTDNAGYFPAEGIYMDNNASGVMIKDNTVTNCRNNGIHLHNSYNITIDGNLLYNNNRQIAALQDADNSRIRGTNITNNIFLSKETKQWASYFRSSADDIQLFGRIDSNFYARPLDDRLVIYNNYVKTGGLGITQNFDLENWKMKYNKDQASKRSAKQIAPFRLNKLLSTTKLANGLFATSTSGAITAACSVSWSNDGKMDGGYLVVAPTGRNSTVHFKIGAVTAGKKYVVKYTVQSAVDTASTISAFMRQDVSPYTNLTTAQIRPLSASKNENELIFVSPSTETYARVTFQVSDQVKYYIDNISVHEVDATITNIDDSIRFEYNASKTAKTISLGADYVDVKNNKYAGKITLNPYEAAVLIQDGASSTTPPANVAPLVSLTSPSTGAGFTSPATISIAATSTDADGTVSKVDFYNGSTLLNSDSSSPYTYTWNNVAAGSYTITAKATDNDGAVTSASSVAVTVNVPNNAAPLVSLTSPSAGVSFTSPATISIAATATDADGTVSKVDFYNGSTLLNSDNTSPYSYTWSNVAAGSYNIISKATDNDGAVTTSSSVAVTVNSLANVAPAVKITSPLISSTYTSPATISVSADASDVDGTIAKVEFYNGNILIGTENIAPYAFTWSNVAAGSYTITSKATDNDGAVTTSSSVAVTVNSLANVGPAVKITSPLVSSTYTSPATISVSADASDVDGTIAKVEFYNGNILIGTENIAPYAFTWSNVAAGSYNITAKATDNDGAVTTSSSVAVTVNAVNNLSPAITLTSPATGASFASPAIISIAATATDADGTVSKVDFYNGSTLLGSDNSSPYTYSWSNAAAGSYTITAKATDNDGAVTTSSSVSISVSAKPNSAPVVSLTSPSAGAGFTSPATISIAATATDADGTVGKVDFYNGSTLLGSDNTSPYTYTWSNVAAGSYAITAKATDDKGSISTSSLVSVTVNTQNNVSPAVAITSPVVKSIFTSPASITVSANASDIDGKIANVQFYNGNVLIKTEYTAPYTFTWGNVAAGSYTITAKATDDDGAVTVSSTVVVTVNAPYNASPVVSITSPASGAAFISPATISIVATASDADGTVSKVDFYNGSTLLGSDNTSPYAYTWTNAAEGSYIFTAKATDNKGSVTTSSSVAVSVNSTGNIAPVVKITKPLSTSTYKAFASIAISADASDADGTIAFVEFYNGTTLIKTEYNAPHIFTWSNIGTGAYTITAKATDNKGAVTTSSSVVVQVSSDINILPAVTITSPVESSTFALQTAIRITADAFDADGTIAKVLFYDGATLIKTENLIPYDFTLSNVAAGTHTIIAKAFDNDGAVTTSSTVVFTVAQPVNITPVVTLTSPVTGAEFTGPATVSIDASATDVDGTISKVDFYNGSTLLGSDDTSPYSYNWSNVNAGSYTIMAKATDNSGIVTTSSSSIVTVFEKTNVAPVVTITNPVSNSTFSSPAVVTIAATASDVDGSIGKVEFYNGASLLGSDSTFPYSFVIDSAKAGSFEISVIAYDDRNMASLKESVSVLVADTLNFAFLANAASVDGDKINITFTTNNTGKSTHFNVQRSNDGVSYSEIGRVAAVAGSQTNADYAFVDLTPFADTNYYKIEQVDKEGKVVTSDILKVAYSSLNSLVSNNSANSSSTLSINAVKNVNSTQQPISIKVGPNPAFNSMYVYVKMLKPNQDIRISILSNTGNIVQTLRTNSSANSAKIDVSSLVNGSYFVQATSGNLRVSQQFVKQ